jgi:hypothetical protein
MSQSKSQGLSLTGTLFVVFLVLKLVGVIDWSWWWVTSPLWIPIVIILGVLVVTFLGVSLLNLFIK